MTNPTPVNEKPVNVLVVDDDQQIRVLISDFLSEYGYRVLLAKNGEEMFAALTEESIAIVILDILLPGDDGFTLCRRLRMESQVPVIMLTALSEDTDRIIGLELGADDYVTKPFNLRELLARIKAILRRIPSDDSHLGGVKHKKDACEVMKFAGWTIDKVTRRLISPQAAEVMLSAGEYNLLLVFAEHPQRVLSRDILMEYTRDRSAGPFDRSIDVQISRLRQKLELDPKNPILIKTVRGGGYIFATKVERVTD